MLGKNSDIKLMDNAGKWLLFELYYQKLWMTIFTDS